jgi:hypothetical protein
MARRVRCYRCGELCASERWAKDHCKPSRVAGRTGYRADSEAHRVARMKIPARRRRAIAKKGWESYRRMLGEIT